MERVYLFLADLTLITHLVFVAFILVGFILIWIGFFRRWHFVRNFYFRFAHLFAMGFVSVTTFLGKDCPLTIWENQLRIKGGSSAQYENTFIGHWLGKLLFFEFNHTTFAVFYALVFVAIVASFFFVKPNWPRSSRKDSLPVSQ